MGVLFRNIHFVNFLCMFWTLHCGGCPIVRLSGLTSFIAVLSNRGGFRINAKSVISFFFCMYYHAHCYTVCISSECECVFMRIRVHRKRAHTYWENPLRKTYHSTDNKKLQFDNCEIPRRLILRRLIFRIVAMCMYIFVFAYSSLHGFEEASRSSYV